MLIETKHGSMYSCTRCGYTNTAVPMQKHVAREHGISDFSCVEEWPTNSTELSEVMAHLERLPDEEARDWLEEHPEWRERFKEKFDDIFASLRDMMNFSSFSDGDLGMTQGIYKGWLSKESNRLSLSTVHFWSTDYYGRLLIDVPHEELPQGFDPEGWKIAVQFEDETFVGEVGGMGMTDGIGGMTTLIVRSDPKVGEVAQGQQETMDNGPSVG